MSNFPLVTIVIVTWNSKNYLPRCLHALSAQTNKNFEILIIDNGSTDQEYLDVEGEYPELRLIIKKINENLGFAVANNIGAHLACGKYLALLNTDAFPEPDWLEQLLKAAEDHPEFNFFVFANSTNFNSTKGLNSLLSASANLSKALIVFFAFLASFS